MFLAHLDDEPCPIALLTLLPMNALSASHGVTDSFTARVLKRACKTSMCTHTTLHKWLVTTLHLTHRGIISGEVILSLLRLQNERVPVTVLVGLFTCVLLRRLPIHVS